MRWRKREVTSWCIRRKMRRSSVSRASNLLQNSGKRSETDLEIRRANVNTLNLLTGGGRAPGEDGRARREEPAEGAERGAWPTTRRQKVNGVREIFLNRCWFQKNHQGAAEEEERHSNIKAWKCPFVNQSHGFFCSITCMMDVDRPAPMHPGKTT